MMGFALAMAPGRSRSSRVDASPGQVWINPTPTCRIDFCFLDKDLNTRSLSVGGFQTVCLGHGVGTPLGATMVAIAALSAASNIFRRRLRLLESPAL